MQVSLYDLFFGWYEYSLQNKIYLIYNILCSFWLGFFGQFFHTQFIIVPTIENGKKLPVWVCFFPRKNRYHKNYGIIVEWYIRVKPFPWRFERQLKNFKKFSQCQNRFERFDFQSNF